jgi:hypothetical protein
MKLIPEEDIMRSSVYRSYPIVLVALAGLVALGCNREGEQVDPDLPIVVEAQGPIALGEAEPTEEEVDFVEEPEPHTHGHRPRNAPATPATGGARGPACGGTAGGADRYSGGHPDSDNPAVTDRLREQ